MLKLDTLIPVFAPAPVAVVIGMQFYAEVERVAPAGGAWWLLAASAAALGVVGTIGAEMFAYKNALKAFADNEPGAALLSGVGGVIASALVIWAVWRTDDSRPLIAAVVIAIVAYIVSGVTDYLARKGERREQSTARSLAALDGQLERERVSLEMEKQRTAQERAKARAANVREHVRSVRPNSPNTQNTKLDPERLTLARAAYAANPKISVRDMARAIGAVNAAGEPAAATGKKYLDEVK